MSEKILLLNLKFFAMDTLLHKSKLFFSVFFLLLISRNINAQCTVTGSSVVNSSTLTCGTSPLSGCNGILYIGDGVTPTTVFMNSALNLTCLGAIQLIVRNGGALDFSAGNDYLTLAEGSSVTFEAGGSLIGGSCNASERLYIGTNLLASCNGGAGADLSFVDLVSFGGTGSATSNTPVCVGNSIVLAATPPPNGTFTYKWTGPNSFTSTLQNPTPFAATTTPNTGGIYIVTMTRSDGKKIDAYTTVVVNTGALPSSPTASLIQPTCSEATGTISVLTPTPDDVLKYSINGLTYTNISGVFTLVSSGTYSLTAKNASGCISPALSVTINAQPTTPAAPTGAAVQSFCTGASSTVANLSATGSGILWYSTSSGGSPLATSDVLSDGIHYYASQTVNGCESAARLDVTVAINAIPAAPTGTAAQSFCSGISPTVASLSAAGSGILWYAASSSGSSLTTSAALLNGIHYFASQTVNGCESTTRLDVTVTINTTPAAPTGAAAQSFCSGVSPTVASLNATGSGILWYATPSGGSSLATSAALSNGIHYYASQTASGCESTTRLDVTVTVNTTPATPTGTAAQSFCSASSPTVASLNVTGLGILWYADPSGGSSLATSTALLDGVHYYASQTVSGCVSAARFDVTVTVNTIPTTPVLPSTLALGCSAISFAANWTNSTGATNYNLDVATDAGFSTILALYNDKALGNVISENVTGLTIGSTFYVRLRSSNSCGTSANSNTMVVSVPTTTYSAGTWDNGVPSSTNNRKAIFASNYVIATELDACSCRINSGVNVVVGVPGGLNDTATLKLENGLDVVGTGTLTFENNASLVQINNSAVNTGSIIYKRNTTPMKNFDYTYWSSPVAGQTLYALSPNTLLDKYLSFSLNKWIVETSSNVMITGKGYIIRVPKPQFWPDPTAATYVQPAQFIGVPNNGAYSLPIDPVGYSNLIGNPYPSAMSADAFLLENSINNNRIQGTIRFWTHNTAINGSGKYTAADYASYNYLGGVGTAAAPSASTGGANINIPSGFIAAGQSFMTISAGGAGPVVFNNSMRVGVENKNTQFFKGTKSKSVAIEKHRVWLNLTNSEGAFKQMLVGYATGATNGFDTAFDGVSADANKYIDFYSINDNTNFVIQGRALPFDKTDKVPLGYKTTIDGTFTISIDQADGALASQSIYVEDKVKGVIVDLKKEAYSFSTTIGTFNDRFVLRFIDNDLVASALDTASLDKPVIVSVQNHQIKINSFNQVMDKLMVYDLTGKLLYENDNVNSNEFIIPNFSSSEQFLIVQVLLKNGGWFTTEIVY